MHTIKQDLTNFVNNRHFFTQVHVVKRASSCKIIISQEQERLEIIIIKQYYFIRKLYG